MADLERLALNVPFSAQQLVDWVDQALLYIHTRDLWRPGFNTIGIRTATDLLDFCDSARARASQTSGGPASTSATPPAQDQPPEVGAQPATEQDSEATDAQEDDATRRYLDLVVSAYNQGQAVNQKAFESKSKSYTKLELKRATLEAILSAMQRDPNIDHISHYWQRHQPDPSKRAARDESPQVSGV
jgi:hypothetical protein